MVIRRFSQKQNILTKPLYEEVFAEDRGAFSDYYYRFVAPCSTIYAAEDETGIHSMIHLNPKTLNWNGELLEIPYIVAVATQKPFRHRGLMRKLLEQAIQDLDRAEVPFAFLMPASESIYRPFGFERTWEWRWEEDVVRALADAGSPDSLPEDLSDPEKRTKSGCLIPAAECSDAQISDLAERVNGLLGRHFEIFSQRSLFYYRRLEKEQKASGGELKIWMRDGIPAAAVQTAREAYPPMMCRVMNRRAYEARLTGPDDRPCQKAFVCEVV